MRWHVCPYCTKEFRKPSDLVRHIRIHTHEKPFKCPQCFRAFAVKSTLTAHVKTHSGVKAFKCQCCMKSFSTSGSLKVHVRLHTGTGLPPQVFPAGSALVAGRVERPLLFISVSVTVTFCGLGTRHTLLNKVHVTLVLMEPMARRGSIKLYHLRVRARVQGVRRGDRCG